MVYGNSYPLGVTCCRHGKPKLCGVESDIGSRVTPEMTAGRHSGLLSSRVAS